MITNLFSSFDPRSRTFHLPLNWISTFLGLMFIPYLYWIIPSRWSFLYSKLIFLLHKELKILLSNNNKGTTLLFVSLFRFIIFNNLLGLVPYVFTSSRHLVITLGLALPLWLRFILYGWINHINHIFAHIVPLRTPTVLIPFIVIIETIRNVIRPGTLAVRLAANIIAGHLLLTLLGNSGPGISSSNVLISILLFIQVLLLLLELAVAIIQSYVFSVLRTLYASEVN